MTGKFKLWIEELRLKEVTLLVGLFIIGYPFAVEQIQLNDWLVLLQLYIGLYCFVAGLMALNNYSGYQHDKKNKRFSLNHSITSKKYFYLFLIAIAIATGVFYWLNILLFRLSLVVLFLWVLYYLPKYGLKNLPITGLLAHIVAQVFQFQMGWVLFANLSLNSFAISGYFALIWGAAYLNHELIDYDADKISGIKTSAVKFGRNTVSRLSISLFISAHIFLLSLLKLGVLSLTEAIPFLVAFLFHIILIIVFSYKNQLIEKPILYRNIYRTLYALASVVLVLLKLKI